MYFEMVFYKDSFLLRAQYFLSLYLHLAIGHIYLTLHNALSDDRCQL